MDNNIGQIKPTHCQTTKIFRATKTSKKRKKEHFLINNWFSFNVLYLNHPHYIYMNGLL